jgi:hypothetical protein
MITGDEVQRFCHESHWGGRIDTLKLSRQGVIVDQPKGGFEYEPMRSYQYTVKEMYHQFKISEYGERQRISNNGRDLSLRRFRELICACMTKAKQRDTADQIVAEFKQCLSTWDLMRRKDNNVKNSIERCKMTECRLHSASSPDSVAYGMASKTSTLFLKYLLCPQIERDELAVRVDNSENYNDILKLQMNENLVAAERRKALGEANFLASGLCKGKRA